MKAVSAVALLGATLAGVLQGALSLVCDRSYDGPEVERPEECQPWSPVCKSTGYCDKCDGSFASGEPLPCSRQVPYCQKSNGRCKPCTSDEQCLSIAYPTCDSVSGACTEYVASPPAPSPSVQSPPPYFVGGDVIAMAGWFPDNEDLQIATSQFEDEGSTYSRDFAVLSLMEVLASDEANTILQGLRDDEDDLFVQLEGRASVLRESSCGAANRPESLISVDTRDCLCDDDSVFLHCEAKMEREFWLYFLEDDEDRRQLQTTTCSETPLDVMVADIVDVMPTAFDVWRECFISDDAAVVLSCVELYEVDENDSDESCFRLTSTCKPVVTPFVQACVKTGFCVPKVSVTEDSVRLCPWEDFFADGYEDGSSGDDGDCGLLPFAEWGSDSIRRELFTRVSIKITAELKLSLVKVLETTMGCTLTTNQKKILKRAVRFFDVDLNLAEGTVEIWPLTGLVRFEFKTTEISSISIYVGMEAQRDDNINTCQGMDNCDDNERGMRTCQMCQGDVRGILSMGVNFAFFTSEGPQAQLRERRRVTTLGTSSPEGPGIHRRLFVGGFVSDVLSFTDTVFDKRDEVFARAGDWVVGVASDVLPEWSASFLLQWPEEDWGACGTCEEPECQGHYQFKVHGDINRCSSRFAPFCNRDGTCQASPPS